MGLDVGKASVSIQASVSGQQAVDQLKNSVKGLSDGAGSLSKSLSFATTALKAYLGVEAIKAGVAFLKNIIDTADGLRDLSQKTNVSVGALSALKTAGELNGIAFDQLQVGLKKFTVNISEAEHGNQKAESGFRALGISAAALKNLKTEDVIFKVSDAFKNMKDGPEKASVAVRLFGKAGFDLIPLLNQGSEKIKEFGLNFSDDFADRAHQFNDTMVLIGVAIKNKFIDALAPALPGLQELAQYFLDTSKNGSGFAETLTYTGEALRLIVVSVDILQNSLRDAGDEILTLVKDVASALDGVGHAFAAAMEGNFSGISDEFKKSFAEIGKQNEDNATRLLDRYAASAKRIAPLLKNSLVLGSGTEAEILARQKAATAPTVRQKGVNVGDVDALNKKQNEGVKYAEDRIRKIEAETAAMGQNEVEKKRIIELAELQNHGLLEGTANYAKYSKELLKAIDAEEEHRKQLAANGWRGAREALEDYIKAVQDLSSQVKSAVGVTLKGLEDQFVDFFTKGKFQWRSFANSIIEEIVRIEVRRAIIAPIAGVALSALGAIGGSAAGGTSFTSTGTGNGFGLGANTNLSAHALGGIMTAQGSVELKKYASGGIARSPQLSLFGEGSTPEAYVPLPDGRRIPVNMQGGSGGGINVSVNVNVASGTETVSSPSQQGADLGKAISSAVRQELIQQKRPGGILSNV